MRTLYLDCQMGAAGDMLTAALFELLDHPQNFLDRLNHLSLHGVTFYPEKVAKSGIMGTHMSVKIHGMEEESLDHHHHHDHEEHHHSHEEHHHDHGEHHHDHGEHHHDHDEHHHEHEHTHHHSSMADIEHIVSYLDLSEKVKQDILNVYQIIAQAESTVHGKPVTEIHFHEVGTMDAIADVTAVCMLMEELSVERVIASPVHVGSGQVKCAHGILPVPAPATALILKDVPTYGGNVLGELCTPTGAALLKYFVKEYGPQPQMKVSKIGYGCGKKEFEQANLVRASLGETRENQSLVVELSCNLDDMTGEEVGYAMQELFDAGALDVYTTSIGMKKNRPGIILTCMCRAEKKEEMIRLIFLHTTTIGIREALYNRYVLDRQIETVETVYGPVRKKTVSGWGTSREKWEYEDLSRIAKREGISLAEVKKNL